VREVCETVRGEGRGSDGRYRNRDLKHTISCAWTFFPRGRRGRVTEVLEGGEKGKRSIGGWRESARIGTGIGACG
jgi:hypothetical protein